MVKNNKSSSSNVSLDMKSEKSETKKGKLCKSGKSIPERNFPVGVVETKNHPIKLYLNLKSNQSQVFDSSINIFYFIFIKDKTMYYWLICASQGASKYDYIDNTARFVREMIKNCSEQTKSQLNFHDHKSFRFNWKFVQCQKIMTKFDTINLGRRLQEPTRFHITTHKNNWKSFLQDFTHESLTR